MPKPWEWKPEEQARAEKAHAEYYLQIARTADELYLKGGENILNGLGLFDAEIVHIRSGQAWTAEHARNNIDVARLCNAYPNAMAYVMQLRLGAFEQIEWLVQASSAAYILGNKKAEGSHLGNLGNRYFDIGEVRKAIEYYKRALVIDRDIGNKSGEGTDLGNLGTSYARLGDLPPAIEYYELALTITRESAKASQNEQERIVARRGEGSRLGNLGNAYYLLGEIQKSIEYYESALAIANELGDKRGKGNLLNNLGNAYASLEKLSQAIEYYQQALAIAREIGDKRGEGTNLGNLGEASSVLGDLYTAMEYYERALTIAREIGDKRGEANRLANLGNAYKKLGNTAKAQESWSVALRIFDLIEDPNAETIRKLLNQF